MRRNYKVVAGDNYGRDNVSESLICSGLTEDGAKEIAAILNREHEGGDRFYRVEPYEYKLYKWEP